MRARLLSSPYVVSGLAGLLTFLVYLCTLAPSVSFIDGGELAAVLATLGVAHPTGYPVFTLVGHIFALLPVAAEEVVRVNIMAAFFCSAGVFMFSLLAVLLLRIAFAGNRPELFRAREDQEQAILLGGFACGLLLGFSETYWATAVAVEVYSLHLFFVGVVCVSFFRAAFPGIRFTGAYTPEPGGHRQGWWTVFAFVLGLSFTNHMTTLLLGPGLIYLYFATQGAGTSSWKRIGAMIPAFLLGLSAYLYLPIRAGQSPAMNWGNPVTLERFLWHVSGKQYRTWMFESMDTAARQLQYFIETLPGEFAYVGLFLAVIGVVALWRMHRKAAIGTLLFFFGCLSYSINYDIHDIDSYFLLAYVSLALWGTFGLIVLFYWIRKSFRGNSRVALSIVVVVAFVPLAVNYQKTDESRDYLVEDYTTNMFGSLKPNAVIFSYQWDYWLAAAFYYQLVKGMRTDVAVVDKELLRRSWYYKMLEQRYPWLIRNSKAEIDAFLAELYKFEHGTPYNPAVIESRYVNMISSMIRRSMASRPVYVTHEIEQEFTTGLQRVPEGLALRVVGDTLFHPSGLPGYHFRPLGRPGRLEDQVPRLYAGSLIYRGIYYYKAGDLEGAGKSFREALVYRPGDPEAVRWLSALGSR